MDKGILENLIKKNLSQCEIAEDLKCSKTNVRYWLKKHGLETIQSEIKKCPKCNDNKPLQFIVLFVLI